MNRGLEACFMPKRHSNSLRMAPAEINTLVERYPVLGRLAELVCCTPDQLAVQIDFGEKYDG